MLALPLLALLSTAAPAAPTLPLVDAKPYDGRYLVILASVPEGAAPPALTAATAEPGVSLVRLRSLELKNLMPCWEVVIAGAFTDAKAAGDLVRRLKKRGVDAYAKAAGRYVGRQPAIAAHCAEVRAGATATKSASGRYFVERHGGGLFLLVDPESTAARDAPAPKMLGRDHGAWLAPLAIAELGDLALGTALELHDASGVALGRCTVKRFVALTRGIPHFGYVSEAKPTAPGCGSPLPFAELTCADAAKALKVTPADAPLFAQAAGRERPVTFAGTEGPSDTTEVRRLILQTDAGREAKTQAERAADAKGAKVEEHLTTKRYTAGKRAVVVAKLSFITGEGNDQCGGEDVNEGVIAVLEEAEGRVAQALFAWRGTWSEVRGVREVDGALEVVEELFPSTTVVRRKSGEVAKDELPFCDCGC